jgi:predicted lipoprotein with Yx(FWY)xxD motif
MKQETKDRTLGRRGRVGVLAAVALAVGGSSALVVTAGAAGAATGQTSTGVVISTMKDPQLGTLLVAGKGGDTVYTLKPSKVACTTECVKIWPEVVLPKGATKATAGKGVNASKLGTVKRAGGVRQVTYGGKPLYWYALDTAPGQVNGNITDKWGKWASVATAKSTNSTPVSSGTTNAGTGGASF